MNGERETNDSAASVNQTESEQQAGESADAPRSSPWATFVPPLAWWWLMLAGATALIVGLGLLRAVSRFAMPLGVVVLGVALAASLAPVVSWLARWLPRKLAVILVYLVLFLALGAAAWWGLPQLVQEARALSDRISTQVQQAEQWLVNYLPIDKDTLEQYFTSPLRNADGRFLATPFSVATSITDVLVAIVTLVFVSLYGLLEVSKFQDFVLSLVPPARQERTRQILEDVASAMGGYVRGVILSGLLVAALTYGGLLLVGVKHAAVLGLISGSFELIPIIGPLIAGVIVLSVALTQSFQTALYALVVMLVVQQVESNIITPLVMRQQTRVNQLLVLVAVIAGGVAGGVFGILVAVPLTAAIVVLVEEVLVPMVRRWSGADGA